MLKSYNKQGIKRYIENIDGVCKILGELPKDRRDNICIPTLEEHQVAKYLAAGVLFQSEVNTVLFGDGGKDPDVLIGDLNVGNAGVVFHQLPESLVASVHTTVY